MGGFASKTREFLGWSTPADTIDDFEDETFAAESTRVHGDVVEFPTFEEEEKSVTSQRRQPSQALTVSPKAEVSRIFTVHPSSFDDVELLGSAFRQGIPVIANLTELDDAAARRVLDFMSGLSYALEGHLERVTSRVFLLSPQTVEVSHDYSRSAYQRVLN